MHDLITILGENGIWVMVIAVVGIGAWFRFREKELRTHEEMRKREMEHLEKMKTLEIELEKARQQNPSERPA